MEETINGVPIAKAWTYRRRTIWSVLTFCVLVITYVLYTNPETVIGKNILENAFMLATASVGMYVFGAVADDRNKNEAAAAELSKVNPWKLRRATMWATMVLAALAITAVVFINIDTQIYLAAVNYAFVHIAGCLFSYVAGAVWDAKPFKAK